MTAVEFLLKQIFSEDDKSFLEFYNGEIQRANKLFEQQINDAFNAGVNSEDYFYPNSMFTESETYYNETYKNETK
jgi:hypothetical protein